MITYSAFWNNGFSMPSGTGNIEVDPLFVDPANGDYHLKSEYGRWDGSGWVLDEETSPCIDAGDPTSDASGEPFPNGGVVNMGAYGGTAQASKSYAPIGIISGSVTDADTGDPVADATVIASGYSDTTGASGVYSLAIPVGIYAVSVSADGYQSQATEDVEVQEDQTTMVDFQLTGSTDIAEPRPGCGCTSSGRGNAPLGLVLLMLVLAAIRVVGPCLHKLRLLRIS